MNAPQNQFASQIYPALPAIYPAQPSPAPPVFQQRNVPLCCCHVHVWFYYIFPNIKWNGFKKNLFLTFLKKKIWNLNCKKF